MEERSDEHKPMSELDPTPSYCKATFSLMLGVGFSSAI